MDMIELGRRLKEARLQRKLTQGALGAPLGMSRSTISGIETGLIAEVGIRKVMALCASLGLELSVGVKHKYPTLAELRQENRERQG